MANRSSRTITALNIVESVALLGVTPLLLFPTVRPQWTTAGLVAIAALALMGWIVRKELWPATPFNAALLVFAAMVGVAWWASAWRDLSWPKLTGILLGLAAFRMLALSLSDRRALAWGLLIFLAIGAAILAMGALGIEWQVKVPLLEPLIRRFSRQITNLPGTGGEAVNANQLAGATVLYLPVLIGLTAGWWRERRRWLALIMCAGALSAGGLLILTQSRGGWIAAAGGLLALIVLAGLASGQRRLRYGAIVLLVTSILVVGGGLAAIGPQRLDVLLTPNPSLSAEEVVGRISLLSRVEIWSRALYAIQDYPLTGVGLGAFRRVVILLYPMFNVSPGMDVAHAHNMFLQVALDVGLPGLAAYLALLWLAGVTAWRMARQPQAPLVRWLALGLAASLISLHIYGITDALALGSKPGLAFWMILGILAALPRIALNQDAGQPGRSPH